MSKTAILTWVDAPPLTAVEISILVDGAPDFTVLDTVAAGVQTLSVPDLADGTYTFRAVAINKTKRSAGVTAKATIDTTVIPADVASFTVELV